MLGLASFRRCLTLSGGASTRAVFKAKSVSQQSLVHWRRATSGEGEPMQQGPKSVTLGRTLTRNRPPGVAGVLRDYTNRREPAETPEFRHTRWRRSDPGLPGRQIEASVKHRRHGDAVGANGLPDPAQRRLDSVVAVLVDRGLLRHRAARLCHE